MMICSVEQRSIRNFLSELIFSSWYLTLNWKDYPRWQIDFVKEKNFIINSSSTTTDIWSVDQTRLKILSIKREKRIRHFCFVSIFSHWFLFCTYRIGGWYIWPSPTAMIVWLGFFCFEMPSYSFMILRRLCSFINDLESNNYYQY